MIRIAFAAVAQIHQHLHFLPAALQLARTPGIEVYVLSASRAGIEFIRSYDPERLLKVQYLWTPSLRRDGPFSPPPRRLVLRLWHRHLNRFDAIVSTEATTRVLKRQPGFRAPLIMIRHGMGDCEAGYKTFQRDLDYMIVAGEKDKQRLVDRGMIEPENCAIAGYGKFELIRRPSPVFGDDKPIALYNPHFNPAISSLWIEGQSVVRAMEAIRGWNFVIAPHVKFRKLRAAPDLRSPSASILFDPGSVRCVDMTYTQSAAVYIGDVSSQVYEFIRTPRPCIFINAHKIDWQGDPFYGHWNFGQVIESAEELGPALERAAALQPRYEPAQRQAMARSDAQDERPASKRQAEAILEFTRRHLRRTAERSRRQVENTGVGGAGSSR